MNIKRPLLLFALMVLTITFAFTEVDLGPEGTPTAPGTKTVTTTVSTAADPFDVMMSVVTHKRCMNCHPSGDRPRQGEDSHLHNFNVQRGPDNQGVAALQCSTCHQQENNNYAGVPGAPHWGLAPASMAWEGLSRTEIATSFLNEENNGGRSLAEIVEHMTEDALVLWVFEPGVDDEGHAREAPPVTEAEYIAAVKAWAEAGAVVPEG